MTRLFQAYADDMLRLAYSYLGSRADAEDVCQTVFLRMAEGRAEPREGKEKVFLLTCTANICKDHLRSFRRWNAGELDETIPFQNPQDQAIHDAVQNLPPKYRAVIHLYYFEGYDQKEIGEILKISLSAVQTRMLRARALLKKELTSNEAGIPAHDRTDQVYGRRKGAYHEEY